MEIYGRLVKAPKILADIVESIDAAVYVDCEFDLGLFWGIIRRLLEHIVTPDVLQQHPVTLRHDLCQKDGREVNIELQREGEKIRASVLVDGQFVVTASSDQRENAKLHAAKDALQKLYSSAADKLHVDIKGELIDIEHAKQTLHGLCGKKNWAKPDYRIEKEIGQAHERRYVCSVNIRLAEKVLSETGDEKAQIKDAEKSAALIMLQRLLEAKYI